MDDFTKLLIDRINNNLKEKSVSVEFNIEKITAISTSEKYAQVNCIFCTKSVRCTFDSGWRISNFLRHVQTHLPNEPLHQSISQSSDAESLTTIERARPTVLAEIKNIIRFF